jgi:hypothetical protein
MKCLQQGRRISNVNRPSAPTLPTLSLLDSSANMAKRKTSAVIPTNPIDTVESVPAQPLRLNTSCHEMLAELHDPAIPKSDIQQKLIAAKQKLDVILGLMPDSSGWVSRFGVAPYGGKNIVGTYVHEKLQNGVPTGQFCITVLVRQKRRILSHSAEANNMLDLVKPSFPPMMEYSKEGHWEQSSTAATRTHTCSVINMC